MHWSPNQELGLSKPAQQKRLVGKAGYIKVAEASASKSGTVPKTDMGIGPSESPQA